MRVGPIGPSPYARGCLGGAAAKALRSKPAQKVPWAPQGTATRASRSRSKARNAARSAAAVGGSTAFRRAGRSRMIVVTGPFVSLRTPGRSITCILLARHGTHGCPCAVCDVGGKFQPRKHNGSCDRGWCASPSEKGKPEALQLTAPTWSYQVRNTVGTRQRRGFDSLVACRLYCENARGLVQSRRDLRPHPPGPRGRPVQVVQ